MSNTFHPAEQFSQQPSAADQEARWYCLVAKVEYGPLRFQHLQRIVALQRLDICPQDLVRQGEHGQWVRVETIPALMRAGGYYDHTEQARFDQVPIPRLQAACTVDAAARSNWLERVPSVKSWQIPGWLAATGQYFSRTLEFVGTYLAVIAVITVWSGLNLLAIFFPDISQELWEQIADGLQSPMIWFGILAAAAYSGAVLFKLRGW